MTANSAAPDAAPARLSRRAEAARLAAMLERDASATERRGRLAEENAVALRAAGFFTLQPAFRSWGSRLVGGIAV